MHHVISKEIESNIINLPVFFLKTKMLLKLVFYVESYDSKESQSKFDLSFLSVSYKNGVICPLKLFPKCSPNTCNLINYVHFTVLFTLHF